MMKPLNYYGDIHRRYKSIITKYLCLLSKIECKEVGIGTEKHICHRKCPNHNAIVNLKLLTLFILIVLTSLPFVLGWPALHRCHVLIQLVLAGVVVWLGADRMHTMTCEKCHCTEKSI